MGQARVKVQGTFILLVSRKPKVTDWSRTSPSELASLGMAGLSWLLPGEGESVGGVRVKDCVRVRAEGR